MPLHCSIVHINFVILSTTDHYLPLLSYVKLDTHHDLIWTLVMDADSKQRWSNAVEFEITATSHDSEFEFYKWDGTATTYL